MAITALVVVVGILVVGSVAEIHAQSASYRQITDHGYGALVAPVVNASNQTGHELATLVDRAPSLPNQQIPHTARTEIQQGLDQAVLATAQQERSVMGVAPPAPSGALGQRLVEVFAERATAVSDLRTAIDRLLGMVPSAPGVAGVLSTAGASPSISTSGAATAMSRVGMLLHHADVGYASVAAAIRRAPGSDRLPTSVWVPAPVSTASLGAGRLGGLAATLMASAALVPFHAMVVTAIGLFPPAVSSGAAGTIGDGCAAPASTVPGSAPTVLPPTATVTADITITNCGTVTESGVGVTETLAVADPSGTRAPPVGEGAASAHTVVTVRSGASTTFSLPGLAVADGHSYTLTVAITPPAGQANLAGTRQEFSLQISA